MEKGIVYFMQERLGNMSGNHRNKLIYKPVKKTENAAFPWMVVELKKEGGDEPQCLRQAANASHMCSVLCEQLAAPAAKDAPPIVAFTSVGPNAKIFLTYRSRDVDGECHVCSSLSLSITFNTSKPVC